MGRNKERIHAPDYSAMLHVDDLLILETDTDSLKTFLEDTGLELVGGKQLRKDAIGSKDISIFGEIVMADSPLICQTAAGTGMRTR